MHRPSLPTAISFVALFFALSGTAYAATGGTFLLGKANTASSVSSLSNPDGTALSLSAKAKSPPLTVSNSVQVPKLNASLLGGDPASAFLGVNDTAVNSEALGGLLASHFVQGSADVNSADVNDAAGTVPFTATDQVYFIHGVEIFGSCDSTAGAQFSIFYPSSGDGDIQAWWINQDGEGQATMIPDSVEFITPQTTDPYTVILQISDTNGGHDDVATTVISEATGNNGCPYAISDLDANSN